MDDSKWPLPSSIATIENPLMLVNVSVTLSLSQIAVYIEYVLNKSLFLTTDITFRRLKIWFEEKQLRPRLTKDLSGGGGRSRNNLLIENVKIP